MSFKYIAQQVSPAHYVLPKVGTMNVEAHVFFSEALYEASEEGFWSQLHDAASYEGVKGVYGMPDGHSGFGVPIGCVIVTDNVLIQAGSGYDINCGMVALRTNLKAQDIRDFAQRELWVREVEKRIATGVGSNRPDLMPAFSSKKAHELLRYGAKALGVSRDLCERQYIPVNETLDFTSIEKAHDKVVPQLGAD